MSSYPKWLYHAEKQPTLVTDEAAKEALGSDWAESPVDVKKGDVKSEKHAHAHAEKPAAHADESHAEKHPKKAK